MIQAQCILRVIASHIVQRLSVDASKVALIVMSQPEILFQLQDIDLTFLRSRQRIQAIDELLANDEVIRSAQARMTAAQNTLTPLRARARNLELEIQANENKAQTSEQQLYSGAIKNTSAQRRNSICTTGSPR